MNKRSKISEESHVLVSSLKRSGSAAAAHPDLHPSDFVRVRKYFSTSTPTQNVSFGSISEYTVNPLFYREIVSGFLAASVREGRLKPAQACVRSLFLKWDALQLERVVCSGRVASLLHEEAGNTFDFV
ncbi:MAG: rRNA-binding ribosome biosynthesis protein utp25 [Phylliscum demangeonii]|nr:MAG: rRNA-binding ribosome biosynthesis protein utp25 [Phylliscum demangeonii]